MLPDRVSNPGPLTYESGALPNALRGPAGAMQYCIDVDRTLFKLHDIGVTRSNVVTLLVGDIT